MIAVYRAKDPQNEVNYQTFVSTKHSEIIKCFGGLDKMLHLCLTNPDAPNSVDQKQYRLFDELLSQNQIYLQNSESNQTKT